MPRKALPSHAKKQIMSVSLPLTVIDRLTETTSNRSKFVLQAITEKLEWSSKPSITQMIQLLNNEIEELTTIQDTYNIKPSELERLHDNLTSLYHLMHPEGDE